MKEKIKKIYQKNGIKIREEDINNILKDKVRTQKFAELYEREKLDSMNYILGKTKNNKKFTKFELEAMSKIDLFNRKVVEVCKNIYQKEIGGVTC